MIQHIYSHGFIKSKTNNYNSKKGETKPFFFTISVDEI